MLDATVDFLAAECSVALRQWLDENMDKAKDSKDAITKTNLKIALKHAQPFCDLKPAELEETIVRTCKITSGNGVKERVKYELNGKEQVYIKKRA